MILKQIKLSQQEKDRLIRIKAKTGIPQWNIICRWALCYSLSNPNTPQGPEVPSDSNIEMSWQTFGGDSEQIYDAIIRQRCERDGLGNDPNTLAHYFRLHLNRGINYLASKNGPKNSQELLSLLQEMSETNDSIP